MSETANVQAAYPGTPGAGWQDNEGACWVLCADGKMRMLVETEEPEDPAELDARFGPMLPLDSNQQQADVVTAEQQQDGAVDLRENVRAWMDGRTDTIDRDDVREIYVVADRASRDLAGAVGELRRVLAERTALAARVAELKSECDLWRTRAHQVGNMLIGERDPEVVPFLWAPGQKSTATETEES